MFLFEAGEGHGPTGQIVGYLDNIFYYFLSKLYSKNFLSNTTIILFSDLDSIWMDNHIKRKDFTTFIFNNSKCSIFLWEIFIWNNKK